MSHDAPLIAMLSVGFVLAFVLGYGAQRLRLPPLVGYLLAGVAIGPFTPGFVADAALASQLAEVGVMLLMFGVGLHFSVADLLAVRRIAVLGALMEIVLATGVGVTLALSWGWSLGAGLVLGLCLSVASTVVLLKALEERNAVNSPNGRIAIGWLIVEDLAMVLVLVLLPAVAGLLGGHAAIGGHEGADNVWLALAMTLTKVGCFVGLALIFGPRVVPWILRRVARTGSRELFTLCVLTVALGIAFGSAKLFGVSYALGAFFAGVVLSESELSHKAAEKSLPLQDAFSVLFFMSVGMLFDPSIIVRQPGMVIATLAVIVLGKSTIALSIILVLGYPLATALTVAGGLAQIGEFSFILAGLGITYGLFPAEGLSLVLAGALLSITLNPLVQSALGKVKGRLLATAQGQAFDARRADRMGRLLSELEKVRIRAAEKTAAHQTLSADDLARRFPLFEGLTADQRDAVVLHFHPREAQPGERVIRAGDKADAAYFIASGQAEVAVAGRIINLGPGDFFGEMALLSGQPRSADVTATDFCELIALHRSEFRDVLRAHPDIRRVIADHAKNRGVLNRQWQDENASPTSPA